MNPIKPVEQAQIERALGKLERLIGASPAEAPDFRDVIARLAEAMKSPRPGYPTRVASRSGERVRFIELSRITHFFAHDKLTYAATENGKYVVDRTIAELESELDPRKFIRPPRDPAQRRLCG